MKIIGLMLLVVGMAGSALASYQAYVPEIDGGTAITALALLSGTLLAIKSRLKK